MGEKTKALYIAAKEKLKKTKFNQYHYVSAYIAISFVVGAIGIVIDANNMADIISYIQIWGIKLLNGGLFLGSFFGAIIFLRGIDFDVLKEIFDEHNIAAALFIGLLGLALAIVLTINS